MPASYSIKQLQRFSGGLKGRPLSPLGNKDAVGRYHQGKYIHIIIMHKVHTSSDKRFSDLGYTKHEGRAMSGMPRSISARS